MRNRESLLSFLQPEACPVLRTPIKPRTIKKAEPVEAARLVASSFPSRRQAADQVWEVVPSRDCSTSTSEAPSAHGPLMRSPRGNVAN